MATAATAGPRYAPEDPTLPKPWKGLVDGKTGYLYFWNPVTNVTQYQRPSEPKQDSPPPQNQDSTVTSEQCRDDGIASDDVRHERSGNGNGNGNGGSMFSSETEVCVQPVRFFDVFIVLSRTIIRRLYSIIVLHKLIICYNLIVDYKRCV